MGNKFKDTGVGEATPKVITNCVGCGKPGGDIPIPVRVHHGSEKYGKQEWLPDLGGRKLCWECWENSQPDKWGLKDEFIKNGLLFQESKQERTERCKDYLRQKGYLGKVIPDRT